MSVLNELKKEAAAIAAARARESTLRARALEHARERLEPRMQALYRYFSEFQQHLQIVEREIRVSYEIRGVGRVDDLIQGQYAVATEHPERMQSFSLRFVCAKPGSLQVPQTETASLAAYRDYLRENGLQARMRNTVRGPAVFVLEPVVPVVIEFSADYERMVIRLRVRNLRGIGLTRHTLSLEQVDEKFMDELARAILRQPNRFDQLVGNTVSESSKDRLRKQIQAVMRQKQLEEALAQREAASRRTITGRFGRTLFGRKA